MKVLSSAGEMVKALAGFDRRAPLFLDTETTGLNPRRNLLVAIQLHQDEPVILDWRHLSGWDKVLIGESLSSLFQTVPVVVGHNIKFDANFLAENNMQTGRLYDTQVAEQVLVGMGAQEGATFGLKDLVFKYTGVEMSKAERTWFFKPKPLNERPEWREPFPDEEVAYMALDVTCLPAIYAKQQEQLTPKLRRVVNLEMRCLPAYCELEQTGMRVDLTGWRAFIADKAREAAALEGQLLEQVALPILTARLDEYDRQKAKLNDWQDAYDAEVARLREDWESLVATWGKVPEHETEPPTWGEYKKYWAAEWKQAHPRPETPKQDTALPNVDSQDQMVGALHALHIPLPLNRMGNPTLDAKALAPFVDQFPLLQLLEQERKAKKFVVAFGENLLELAEDEGEEGYGRLHPTIHSIGAATGRNSMSDPNLQQVPSRGDGARLRALVQAPPGHQLVVCDFSSIEWRIMAAVSKEPTAIRWLCEGVDIHEAVAREVWGLAPDVDVTDRTQGPVPGNSYRDIAKVINYGLLYGMSFRRLARVVKCSEPQAAEILDHYFAVLPGFRTWLDEQGARAVRELHTETLLGRVRAYRQPLNGAERGRVARQGCNAVIQGTNADITKGAVALYYEAERHGRLIAVVHDELVVEVPDEFAEAERRLVEDCMDRAQVAVLPLPRAALPRPVAKLSGHWEH